MAYSALSSKRKAAVYTKRYGKFAGVDYSTDPSQVADSRSPDAVNMMPDDGLLPVKRVGWRVLTSVEAPVNGVFAFQTTGGAKYAVHGGTKLYAWDGEETVTEIMTGLTDGRSSSFAYGDKLYILTGGEYLSYDGTAASRVKENAYIPTTSIAAPPTGGGQADQQVNLLTPRRKNTFIGDGSATTFRLDARPIDASSAVKVWTLNAATGAWDEMTTGFTVGYSAGTVTFTAAPAAPVVSGTPNVMIEFAKTVTGYADRVGKCRFAAVFSNRVFLAGNTDFPNTDFQCELNDPTYFPDLGYTEIGADRAAIMGYLPIGGELGIVKEDSGAAASIFVRSAGAISAEINDIVFAVRQGMAGIGAISPYAFASLGDDPLFLSRSGVYSLASQYIVSERSLQSRSKYVNPRLTLEAGLETAAAARWGNFYLLCVNGHAYLADGRQRSYTNNLTGTFEYEWCFWDNIPARMLCEWEGSLFFGTEDGRLCRFNTDLVDADGVTAMQAYNDGGEPISASWSTKMDDDGDFAVLKTMIKKGSAVYAQSFKRSGMEVYIRTSEDFGKLVRKKNLGIFSFDNLDFDNFTFNTLPQGIVVLNSKTKKYKFIQIVCKNDKLNEAFGLYGIERRYVIGNYVK